MNALRLLAPALLLAAAALAVSPTEDLEWWQTSVIYQIYPRSFMDSDGDGTGDIQGIISKLDYLKDLGVGAVWLSPIYKSPMVDMGYDISDFYEIDELFGTMDDFMELLKEAHDKDLKVVMDFVVSYTSDEVPWFEKSINKEEGYDDWFVWEDGKGEDDGNHTNYPNNWLSAFTGTGWAWNEVRQQFYFHSFTKEQPDLNYREQAVINEMDNVLKYWFDMGVDGFRVDAVPQMVEDFCLRDEVPSGNDLPSNDYEYLTHKYTQHQPETYEIIKHWRKVSDSYTDSPRVLMLETYGPIDQIVEYYGTTENPGGHFPFNFYIITELNITSRAKEFNTIVHKWMDNIKVIDWPNWVLGNHDQRRVGTRFGKDRVDAMNMFSTLLPGTAITFMGEEIGMEDNLNISWEDTRDPWAITAGEEVYMTYSRDPERTPFQWDATDNAGFTTNDASWLPVNDNYRELNLEAQQAEERSHYHVYKSLVQLRQTPAFQRGTLNTSVINEDVFAFSRTYGEETYVVVLNLGDKEQTVDLSELNPTSILRVEVASVNSEADGQEFPTNEVVLEPYASLVLQKSEDETTTPADQESTTPDGTSALVPFSFLLFAMLAVTLLLRA